METYDAIVLGTGGVGSAALFHLARRGAQVLGLDRFDVGHDRGSSHGHTRMIRQAYFEHPDYVPLVLRAYEWWEDLAQRAGRKLYFETGLLEIGPTDGPLITGVLAAAEQHGLQVEQMAGEDVAARFGQFAVADDAAVVFERNAGYLLVEECVRAHCHAACERGAESKTGVEVHGWSCDGKQVHVATSEGEFSACALVVAAGPWAGDVVHDLGVRLTVRRKSLFWYATDDPRLRVGHPCPAFFFEAPEGYFYGFPAIDERGVKLAEHSGGQTVADPLYVDRDVDNDERRRIEQFASERLPGVSQQMTDHAVCMYTMTPDEHFVVDRHPNHPQVVLAAGLSGHGFKFTVLGEALADLATEGKTRLPIQFLGLSRPAIAKCNS